MSETSLPAVPARAGPLNTGHIGFIVAWGFCLLFYFGQYALRSAPGASRAIKAGILRPSSSI